MAAYGWLEHVVGQAGAAETRDQKLHNKLLKIDDNRGLARPRKYFIELSPSCVVLFRSVRQLKLDCPSQPTMSREIDRK